MGSVKDIITIRKPTQHATGVGRFHFSDRYSVFDWGEMPDRIERKGEALCLMAAYCFERFEEEGIETHYRGLVTGNQVFTLKELKKPSSTMEVELVNVYKPKTLERNGKIEYDYSVFKPNLTNFLIPLEIIYRNGLPEGSSVFRRLEQGLVTIAELGLTHYPRPGEHLSKPILDLSTKLESKDRYVTWAEAQRIAGLTDKEIDGMKDLLLRVNELITQTASNADLKNEDGKIELAFNPERELTVVDVAGTLDECRFTYKGLHVSKEIARQFYRNTKWYADVEEAKGKAESHGIEDWRSICRSQPPRLDLRLGTIISQMYMAATNEITNHRYFDAPPLVEVIAEYEEYEGEKRR